MSSASASYGCSDGVCVLRLGGNLRFPSAPAFDLFLDQFFARADFASLMVDLHDTHLIDSTWLGVLARIGTFAVQHLKRRAKLLCRAGNVASSLKVVGFDDVFDMSGDAAPTGVAMQEVSLASPREGNLSQIVLQAHRQLLALNAANQEAFAEVVSALERELAAHERR